ncbi:hypothetical protein CCP3SC5AM1_210023 [Gammaproteobacteria bacterium]
MEKFLDVYRKVFYLSQKTFYNLWIVKAVQNSYYIFSIYHYRHVEVVLNEKIIRYTVMS